MEIRGNNAINHFHLPLKRCSTYSEEYRIPTPSSLAELAIDTFTSRVKIVRSTSGHWAGKSEVVDEYTHLLSHRVEQPTNPITWLSALPDHLISRILSFLFLKEAGRTSILSKRWRYLWSFMPKLSLPMSMDAVTHVLENFRSPIVCSLDFSTIMLKDKLPTSMKIDSWLSLAFSRMHVEDLVLRLNFLEGMTWIHFFGHDFGPPAFSALKRLTLRYCMLSPSAAKSLTSLEYLELERVQVLDDNMVHELTSSCLMLGELKLTHCNSNIPLRLSITNPRLSKLTIDDNVDGNAELMLQLWAPYLATLVFVSIVGRRYELKVPSLSTLKLSNFMRDYSYLDYQKAALVKILSSIDTREVYLCSMVPHFFSRQWAREGLILESPVKVKHLHLQTLRLSKELPGLVYLLNYYHDVETLVFDFDNKYFSNMINVNKHLKCLNCGTGVLKDLDDEYVLKYQKERIGLCDKDNWNSFRVLLSSKMQNLKYIEVNGFKLMLRIEKASRSDFNTEGCYHVVDKYEFDLLRLLLNYSLGLENMIIRTKNAYLIEDLDDEDKRITAIQRNNKCLDKIILTLPKGSTRAKISLV